MTTSFKDDLLFAMRSCVHVNQIDWSDDELDQTADALIAWRNIVNPDSSHLRQMISVFSTGLFKWWYCPTCRHRVCEGEEAIEALGEGWGKFQSVDENDHMSYPGRGDFDLRCDACRCRDIGSNHLPRGVCAD